MTQEIPQTDPAQFPPADQAVPAPAPAPATKLEELSDDTQIEVSLGLLRKIEKAHLLDSTGQRDLGREVASLMGKVRDIVEGGE